MPEGNSFFNCDHGHFQESRKRCKLNEFPGSSTVEHSAVNCMAEHHKPLFWRRLAIELSPLIVPQMCPAPFANARAQYFIAVHSGLPPFPPIDESAHR